MKHRPLLVMLLMSFFIVSSEVQAKGFGGGGGHQREDSASNSAEFDSEGDVPGTDRVEFLISESERADQTGDEGKRLKLLREAASLSEGAPGGWRRIEMFQNLASAEQEAGNLLDALAARDVAAKMSGWGKYYAGKRLNAFTSEISLYLSLGDTNAARAAMASADQAMSFAQSNKHWKLNANKWLGNLEMGRGEIAQAEGRYADAEVSFRRSLKLYENYRSWGAALGSKNDILHEAESAERHVENVLAKLTNILQLQGRLSESELYARQLVKRAQLRQGENAYGAGRGHRIMSGILAEQGRYADAECEAKAAIASLKAAGVLPFAINMVHAQQALAISLAGQEKWPDAAAVFEQAHDVLRADPMLEAKLGLGNPHWALTLIHVGQAGRAVGMLQKMLVKQLKIQPETAFQPLVTRGLLGLAQYAAGQEEVAEVAFRTSVPILLDNLHQLNSEDQGTSASELMLRQIVDGYVDLLMQRQQAKRSVPNGDPLDLAFRYADMASAGSVSRALAASGARSALGSAELAEMVRSEQDMSQRISVFGQTIERLSNMRDPQLIQKTIDSIRQDLEKTRSARTTLRGEIVRRFPSYAGLVNPRPPGLADIAMQLKPDEVFVSIHPTDGKTYVWAIRKGQIPDYAVIDMSRQDIGGAVDTLRRALDPGANSMTQFPPFDVNLAHQLYLRLFDQVKNSLARAERLIVVTPGPLGRLPLGLLVTDMPSTPVSMVAGQGGFSEYQKVSWLVRKYAITSLPSASNFPALRLNQRPLAKEAFAGFGDPLFSAKQTSAATTRGVLRNLTVVKNEAAQPEIDQSGIVSGEGSLLPQLPETRDEILAMANVLHADLNRDVFLGSSANEAVVRRAGLSDRRVIAFSTHGLVPGELAGLDSPALALTAPELASTRDPGDNGFLTLEKVLQLKLNAEWVVLSACNTAAGEGAGTEAFSGLGRAFFFAGARSILVSHWPVESKATEKLITLTLRNYAIEPAAGRAQALRFAELELIDSPSLSHPLFWSAFSLVGEGGTQ